MLCPLRCCCSAIDGLSSGEGTVPRRGSSGYSMPGVHVNQETLAAAMAGGGGGRALDRNRLSNTERLLQNTQHIVKQTEEKKGEGGWE